MTQCILEIRDLTTRFETTQGVANALDHLSLEIYEGEVIGLVGESGSGKSMTGYSIMGLIEHPGAIVNGSILYRGQDLCALDKEQLRQLRGDRIAMIFQDPMMSLNPVLRIDTQLVETLKAHRAIDHRDAIHRATELLQAMGIPSPEARLRQYPHELSGGMRQRIAIAIALLLEPDLIIADEPTTALDVTIQAQIIHEFQTLIEARGTSVLWITNDLAVASTMADRLAIMYAGQIVERGPANEVLENPAHPYTEGLLRSIPSRNVRGKPLQQIPGSTPSLTHLPPGCPFAPRCERAASICATTPPSQRLSGSRSTQCHFPREVPS
ncbi:MAG: ABC transporter ATP-binding protein [Litorivicinaceae bacterium]